MVVKPKQLTDVPNEKYFNIVTEIVKAEQTSKLLRWSTIISEENKKGLRMMKTIVD